MRGVHRYAADAFAFVTLAHLAREWLLGRYTGFRWFSWLTGVPLLPLVFACGIGGFWLNWDRLGQFSAVATAEWLDALPFLATPLARNFLGGAVNDRLFSLFVFVHLGVPLLLVFGLWFHIQRISRAEVFPPRALAWALARLCWRWRWHAGSQPGPADLALVPVNCRWTGSFCSFIRWPMRRRQGCLDAARRALAGLFALPFLRAPLPGAGGAGRSGQLQRLPALCRRLPLRRRDDGASSERATGGAARAGRAGLCASCGICVGACPLPRRFEGPRLS